MHRHVPTFPCRRPTSLVAGGLLALWLALCGGFVASVYRAAVPAGSPVHPVLRGALVHHAPAQAEPAP